MSEIAVLVTRPSGQADSLMSLLAEAGYRGVHCPMLVIEELPEPDPGQRAILQSLADYQHLVFVSSNAVRFGMGWIEDFWLQLPTGLHWYTLGDGSAAALAQHGVEALQPAEQMNSEGLLALPALQEVRDQRVLIIKGEGGREMLRETLRDRGARVDELACYRRRAPAMGPGELAAIIRDADCRALLLSSGEGLRNMVSLLDEQELDQVRGIALIVPGARVGEEARRAGFSEVLEAANATDTAMLATLGGAGLIGG